MIGSLRPSNEARQRMDDWLAKSKDGTISRKEESELDEYLQLERILILAKARVRKHTRLEQ